MERGNYHKKTLKSPEDYFHLYITQQLKLYYEILRIAKKNYKYFDTYLSTGISLSLKALRKKSIFCKTFSLVTRSDLL